MPKQIIWFLIALMATIGLIRVLIPPPPTQVPNSTRGELFVEIDARGNYTVGDYTVTLSSNSMNIASIATVSSVWKSAAGSFLTAATGEATSRNHSGLVRFVDAWAEEMSEQSIVRAGLITDEETGRDRLLILGSLQQPQDRGSHSVDYELWMEENPHGLLKMTVTLARGAVNRLSLVTALQPDETVLGGGLQYHDFDGTAIPIMPRLHGIGRGDVPLTLLQDLTNQQGGGVSTTAAPLPRWITSATRSAWFDGDDTVVLDTRIPTRLSATVWNSTFTVYFSDQPTIVNQIIHLSQHFGIMKEPPMWAKTGLIVGANGESIPEVIATVEQYARAGQMPVAVWVPDLPPPMQANAIPQLAQAFAKPTGTSSSPVESAAPDKQATPAQESPKPANAASSPVESADPDKQATPAQEPSNQPVTNINSTDIITLRQALAVWSQLFAEQHGKTLWPPSSTGTPSVKVITVVRPDVEAIDRVMEANDQLVKEKDGRSTERAKDFVTKQQAAMDVSVLDIDGVIIEGLETLNLPSHNYQQRADAITAWVQTLSRKLETIDEPLIITRTLFNSLVPQTQEVALGELLANFSINDGLPSTLQGQLNGIYSGLFHTHHAIGGDTTIAIPRVLGGVTRTEHVVARSAQLAAFGSLYRTGIDKPTSGAVLSEPPAVERIVRWFGLHQALREVQAEIDAKFAQEMSLFTMRAPEDPASQEELDDISADATIGDTTRNTGKDTGKDTAANTAGDTNEPSEDSASSTNKNLDATQSAGQSLVPAHGYMEPTLLEAPNDHQLKANNTTFFYGPDMYVAPVIDGAIGPLVVDLPLGNWRDVWTGISYNIVKAKERSVTVEWNVDRIPMWVRVGSKSEDIMEAWVTRLPEYLSKQALYKKETIANHQKRIERTRKEHDAKQSSKTD